MTRVDGLLADPEVGGHGFRAPAVQVERHHRASAVPALLRLVVRLEQARELERHYLVREDPRRGVLAETPSGADVDDVGDLVVVELRVLGLELDDHATAVRLQASAPGPRHCGVGREEAQHAVRLEALDPAVHGPLRGARLGGPFRNDTRVGSRSTSQNCVYAKCAEGEFCALG
jgi:hypothetical protein